MPLGSLHEREVKTLAYYADLSPYEYTQADQAMLNVGWLARDIPFNRGRIPRAAFDALLVLADSQVNIMRGVHDCEFCSEESPIRMSAPNERGFVSLGMGEVHVVSDDGRIFVAPSLVLHYIRDHGYLPPEDFIRALTADKHPSESA